jgi:hypothetical protein
MPIRALQVVDAAGTADVVSVAASAPRTDTSVHARWVRLSHWILAASIFTLAFTGFIILMAHPRLYWGETGNGLTPALLELPISRNHRHGGWQDRVPFFGDSSMKFLERIVVKDKFDDGGKQGNIQNGWAWYAGI